MIRVATLPTNTSGRDFVIGDLHGHYDILMALLLKNKFDQETDRVISVGDIIDRGPRSWDCLQLLRKPWFHSVRGNHEDRLLDMAIVANKVTSCGAPIDSQLLSVLDGFQKGFGSEWFLEWLTIKDNHHELASLIAQIRSMSHIIAVRGTGFEYNVVHAELTGAGIITDADITRFDGLVRNGAEEALLWSRKLFLRVPATRSRKILMKQFDPNLGLSMTFCGHSVTAKPLIWNNHVFLDTGSGYAQSDGLGFKPRLSAFIVPECKMVSAATPVRQHHIHETPK